MTLGQMAQRGLWVLPNQGGGRKPGDIRGAICPSVIGLRKPACMKNSSRWDPAVDCALDWPITQLGV